MALISTLKSGLPAVAPFGTVYFCSDTDEIYIGTGTGNLLLSVILASIPQPPVQGPTGAQGPPGIVGADSITPGPTGEQGIAGRDGAPGKDSQIPGPTGPAGPQGVQGPTGVPGKDGVSAVGPQGVQGRTGPTGPAGPQGVQGLTGPIGPAGAAGNGAADVAFVWAQNNPNTIWRVQHNLGKFPSVTVVDSSGHEVFGDVNHVSSNLLTIVFSAAFAGTAYLN